MNRRSFLSTTAAAWAIAQTPAEWSQRLGRLTPVARPTPSPVQLLWQRDELAMFCHFGVNTFTNTERGDGTEDPAIFAPGQLDCQQWARAAKAGGFRSMILTAKHHDGFCLWPSATTKHSVASSPWRGGAGDLVREFVDACRGQGMRPGLYLSPWDRNNPTYGDSPRYNDLYCEQLTELLTRYGSIAEVWFDGANGEGPNGKQQTYDWPRIWGLVKRLQPDTVIFSDAGPDVRWGGNENGSAGDPNWSMVDPSVVPVPGMTGPTIVPSLQHGDPAGTVWRPAEADVSIRPGWFNHPAEDARVKTVDQLYTLYLRSVGRNSKLLLNVPPTRDGLLHATDVERITGLRARLDALNASEVQASWTWRVTGPRSAVLEADLGRSVSIGTVRLAEEIEKGQLVSGYTVSGMDTADWTMLSHGTTIGNARIDRLMAPASARRVRVEIETLDAPASMSVRLFTI